MSNQQERVVVDAAGLEAALERLALAISSSQKQKLALVGIRTRGEFLAKRLAARLKQKLGREVPLGILDTTFYRDDFKIKTKVADGPSWLGFDVEGRDIVLVDDVLYTGRTTRAALDHLTDYGRAASVSLAVLVDRGHRELPIAPDYVGISITTDKDETIKVRLKESDGKDEVVAIRAKAGPALPTGAGGPGPGP